MDSRDSKSWGIAPIDDEYERLLKRIGIAHPTVEKNIGGSKNQ